MTILEACYLVLVTTSLNIKNKTFVLNMGKPINIYQVAKKLGLLKEKLNSNYKFQHQEIGLRKNEKLHEILFDRKEKKHKINKNLFYVTRKKINNEIFIKYFKNLENIYKKGNDRETIKVLKKICQI
jgi:FlaA1/EpsC-like NDP-sugar epimerase